MIENFSFIPIELLTPILFPGFTNNNYCILWQYFGSMQGMKKQSYPNHIRYYPPHHFIFLPLLGFLLVLGAVKSFRNGAHRLEWILFTIVIFCILYLALMVRQHYALGNQDRIVRLEFRLRYFELYGRDTREIEKQISFQQIAALRFANDDEFKVLLEKAIKGQLGADGVKRQIKDWQADDMRV